MSGRSSRAFANNTIPLARKGLEVAHTIGEASNLNVLKGLSGLALLILDTCEVRDNIDSPARWLINKF